MKPAELGLEEKLFGLLLACLRFPEHIRGLVQRCPIAQMDEATMNCVKQGRGRENQVSKELGGSERERKWGEWNPGSV